MLSRDPMDDKDIMLEIRGGAGGDEANIFAGDLMRMYLRFADKQGWQSQILSKTDCEAGGVLKLSSLSKGTAFIPNSNTNPVFTVYSVYRKQNHRGVLELDSNSCCYARS
ncbi:MAG: PCRF domain-containing protein [Candidatus Gastranaerophilaceae bacterium]